jgi:hypothetical protein
VHPIVKIGIKFDFANPIDTLKTESKNILLNPHNIQKNRNTIKFESVAEETSPTDYIKGKFHYQYYWKVFNPCLKIEFYLLNKKNIFNQEKK